MYYALSRYRLDLKRLLREPLGHPAFITIVLVVRIVAVFGLTLRFGLNKADYASAPQLLNAAWLILVVYFLYLMLLLFLRQLMPAILHSRGGQQIQILVDLAVFSALYYLTMDIQSDLFLLYGIPLLLAAEYFSLLPNLAVSLVTMVVYGTVLYAQSHAFPSNPPGWVLKVLFPRFFFFIAVHLAYLVDRRLQSPTSEDVEVERRRLFDAIDQLITPDVARGLFIRLESYTRKVGRNAVLLEGDLQRKDALVSRQLAAIFAASQAAIAGDEEHAICSILQAMGEALNCQAGALRLLGQNRAGHPSLVLRASYGYFVSPYQVEARYLDLDSGSLVVEAFRNNRVISVEDIQARRGGQERSVQYIEFHRSYDLHAMICVPWGSGTQPRGTLTLYRETTRDFTKNEADLLRALSSFLGLALANFDHYREARIRADENQKWLEALHRLGTRLTGFEDLNSLMAFVCTETRAQLSAEVCSVFLLDDERLCRKKMDGLPDEWFEEESYAAGEGLTGRVLLPDGARPGTVICENHVDENTLVLPPNLARYQLEIKSGVVKHLLAVPLIHQTRCFGVLRLLNKLRPDGSLAPGGFTEHDQRLLYTIGCEVGIAIENGQLMDDMLGLEEALSEISASLEVGEVLEKIVWAGRRLRHTDHTSLGLVKDEDNSRLERSVESSSDLAPLHERARPGGVIQSILKTGVPVVSDMMGPSEDHNPELLRAGFRSLACLPLTLNKIVIGVLAFYSRQPGVFTNRLPLLQAFAGSAAVAIEKTKLLVKVRRRAEDYAALYLMIRSVSETLDLDTILVSACKAASELFKVDHSALVLFEPDHTVGRVVAEYPDIGTKGVEIQLAGVPVEERLIREGVPINIPDASREPGLGPVRGLFKRFDIQSTLLIPIVGKDDEVLGSFSLDAVGRQVTLGDTVVQLGQLFATQAAVAIQNSKLHEEAIGQRELLREYLQTIGENLVKHTDVEGLCAFAVHSGARLLKAEDCSLYLADPETGLIHFRAASFLPVEELAGPGRPVSAGWKAGLTSWVAATGELLKSVGDKYMAHDAWAGEYRDHLKYFASGKCNSLLIVPMRSARGTIVGVLKCENKLGSAAAEGFSDFDEEMLTVLANQVATNIQRVEFYARVTQEAARRERARLQGELHDTLNIFHSGAMLEAEVALDHLKKQRYEKAEQSVYQSWRVSRFIYGELSNILEDMRDPILSKDGLAAALHYSAQLLGPDLIHLNDTWETQLDFDTEYALFRIAQGAISNAMKHGITGRTDGRITVDLDNSGGEVLLRVADNGHGFDLSKNPDDLKAYGLGRMRELARSLGTELVVETTPSKGTIVTVSYRLDRRNDGETDHSSAG